MTNLLITGSSGFIGSCLVEYLIKKIGIDPANIHISDIANNNSLNHTLCKFVDPYDALSMIKKYSHIIHLGAQSETNNTNKKSIYKYNIKYTTKMLEKLPNKTRMINASSASIYKQHNSSIEESILNEQPQSLYSFSKCHIDNLIRNIFIHKNIYSLRFFNVCSFFSEHNKLQPSPTFSFLQSITKNHEITLFNNSDLIYRDFIYVSYVLDIICHFMTISNCNKADIINVGCGQPVSFYDIAATFQKHYQDIKIKYIDKPKTITKAYQSYTNANIDKLRSYGYHKHIPSIIDTINNYVKYKNINNFKPY